MSRTLSQIAAADIGLSEDPRGSNKGAQLTKFFKATDMDEPDGYPWCAAAVSYWTQAWANESGKMNFPPRLAAVSLFDEWADKHKLHMCSKPTPNAIVVFNFSHVAVVESVNPDGQTITTIEGNTNDDGSREGYAVFRKTRPLSVCKFFIQLPA